MRLPARSTKAVPSGTALLFLALLLAACATPERFGGSRQAVLEWSRPRGFTEVDGAAGRFRLLALVRGGTSRLASVYIEGDGAAWSTPYHPPGDPTPTRPVALALAAADPAATVIYLGRPCQYLEAIALQACDSAYWTERRFAPEVIEAYSAALTRLKQLTGTSRMRLHGYSGGGVIAALLATRRDDVEALVTVAAPLSLATWLAVHDASPLRGSLDPGETNKNGRSPPGVHFVGSDDRTVPPAVVEDFVRRAGGRMEVVPGYDHECCWVRDWPDLLQRVTDAEGAR
jgi:pimeloyl-ACP methyl ester carboxylesterase